MRRVIDYLHPFFRLAKKHPILVIVLSAIVAATSGYFALQLKIDTDIANLLPESYESVQALKKLEKMVGGETALEVIIQSPDFEANKKMARTITDSSLALYDDRTDNPFFSRAEFRKETEVLENNALYLATESELETIQNYLKEEIDQAKLEANPFYIDLEEGENEDDSTDISAFEQSYRDLIPSEYPVSSDSSIVLVKLYPTGSKSDLQYLRDMFRRMDRLIQNLDQKAYHPQMRIEYGGRLTRHLSEFTSIINDVLNSFTTGIGSVILLVMLYFFVKKYLAYKRSEKTFSNSFLRYAVRIPIPVLVIGLPLIMSLLVTFGITYFVYGSLNTMTSVLFVVLFGLGIDYGIHFYARYIEIRSSGKQVYPALEQTYQNIGSAILTTALTTSAALFVLVFADFKGFSEFGFIAGIGILLALAGMLYLMPAFITLFEKMDWILIEKNAAAKAREKKDINRRFPLSRIIVVTGFALALMVVLFSGRITFQYDFGELEPDFPEYDAFRELTHQVSRGSRNNPAYIIADSNKEVREILAKLRHKMKSDTTSPTIAGVEAIQERFPPTDEEAQEKLKEIAKIRELLQDPFLKDQEDTQLDTLRRAAQTKEPMELSQIPDYLTSQFMTKSGEVGKFVIVYPSLGLGNGRNSIAFKKDVGEVTLDNGKTFYAASTSLVAAEMLMLMQKESPYMVGATFILVFIFMYISFRSLKWSLIAMLPLVVGLLWMFGVMLLTGLMLNFYNLVVLPAILGIGEDNGVHLTHRYQIEGKGSIMRVLASTGQHITIGSVTTILGFFGLIFTNHPGLQTIGFLAMLGIGMTLVAGLTLHPALIQWMEDRAE